jgi:hypothetical protein
LLEGRHPEAAIEPHLRCSVLIHARRLEDGRHTVARCERDSGRIGFLRRVEKDRRARRASEPTREETFGGFLIVREERPDLEPRPAPPENAVARQALPIHDAEADSLLLANP